MSLGGNDIALADAVIWAIYRIYEEEAIDHTEGYAPKFDSVDELLAWLARGEAMTEQEVPQGSPVPPPDEPVTVPDLTEPEDEGEVDNGLDTEHQDQQTG